MENTVKRRKGRGVGFLLILLLILLLIAAYIFFVVIYPNTAGQRYKEAQNLLLGSQYTAAAEIFEELGDYEDASRLLLECRYGQAENLLTNREFQDAIVAYTALGDYQDCPQKIQTCYFELGKEAFERGEYKEAVSCFLQAGDDPDVQLELDRAYYEYGHQLFLKGLYVAAKEKFDQIQTLPENAQPHFRYLEDAQEYLQSQADILSEEISCLISQCPIPPPGDTLWDVISNYVSFQSGSVYYDDAEKTLFITAEYHPGMKILRAWENGDDSVLSDDEKQALQAAEDLVGQAKQSSEDPMEVELYLYNWLCENVEYESPDMSVEGDAYRALRQLNCMGALVDGKANCQGYTDAFYLLGNMAGFDVCKMGGTGQWEPHTWNGILLDDKLYVVDVTFGDVDTMGQDGKTYTWFNCAYDPETYTIDGGVELFPQLVMDDDLSKSYYHSRESIFDSAGDAAYYLLRQYKANGKGITYAMVEGAELDNNDFEKALSKQYRRAGVYSYNCTWILETYCGNTYLTVQWK